MKNKEIKGETIIFCLFEEQIKLIKKVSWRLFLLACREDVFSLRGTF
jgi:hypothetical protein